MDRKCARGVTSRSVVLLSVFVLELVRLQLLFQRYCAGRLHGMIRKPLPRIRASMFATGGGHMHTGDVAWMGCCFAALFCYVFFFSDFCTDLYIPASTRCNITKETLKKP